MSLNHELAALFERMAQIMEIKGENQFKCLAFHKVARTLGDLTVDLRQAAADGTLADIEGIGQSSRRIILQYVADGRSDDYEEVAASVPEGLPAMLAIPGLGPKTIALFWKQRQITSIDQLKRAIMEGKLDGLKGVGEKKLQSIMQGIELLEKGAGRVGIVEAWPVARAMLEQVRGFKGVLQAEVAGSLRRCKETIGDVDLICCLDASADAQKVSDAFAGLPQAQRVLGQGPTKASVLTDSGLQVDLRLCQEAHYGATLAYFTGSKEHNVRLRSLALEQGMTLNEWGLYKIVKQAYPDKSGGRVEKETGKAPAGKPVASRSEADIYAALGLDFVEPELREDRGEVEAAQRRQLPRLLEQADIRGDLHNHTTASDGTASIEEMARAAADMGYKYLAITDHSKSSVIANGLSVERLMKHVAAIRRLDGKIGGLRLLAGAEVDILADGRLDYEDAVLAELDIVVASPHVALKQDPAKATERLLRAIENPHVNIIGHPTGRYIGQREGLSPDFSRLFAAAASARVAMEINSSWPRLDLNDIQARAAAAAGVMISINTDSHAAAGFAQIKWGVMVGRRAWLTSAQVINCMDYDALCGFLSKKSG